MQYIASNRCRQFSIVNPILGGQRNMNVPIAVQVLRMIVAGMILFGIYFVFKDKTDDHIEF